MPNQNTLKLTVGYSLSALLLTLGLTGIAQPTTISNLLGLPISDQSNGAALTQLLSGRHLTMGAANTAFLMSGNLEAAGLFTIVMALDGLVDGWVNWTRFGFGSAAPHFVGMIVFPWVGAWMRRAGKGGVAK